MQKKMSLFVLTLVLIIGLAACSSKEKDVRNDESGELTIDFTDDGMVYNGTDVNTYHFEKGQEGTVNITIEKKSGEISLKVYAEGSDTTNYVGQDLDSSAFAIILSEVGEYKVRFEMKDYIGKYKADWQTK